VTLTPADAETETEYAKKKRLRSKTAKLYALLLVSHNAHC